MGVDKEELSSRCAKTSKGHSSQKWGYKFINFQSKITLPLFLNCDVWYTIFELWVSTFIQCKKHKDTFQIVSDVFDTIPLIPFQPLPQARAPQLRCHQPPVFGNRCYKSYMTSSTRHTLPCCINNKYAQTHSLYLSLSQPTPSTAGTELHVLKRERESYYLLHLHWQC